MIKVVCVVLVLAFLFAGCSIEENCSRIKAIFNDHDLEHSGFGLLFFFSIQSCPPCMEISHIFGEKVYGIPVIGVLSKSDENELERIKAISAFPVVLMSKKYRDYQPLLSPSLVAVDRFGRVLMILPGLPGQNEYLDKLLLSLVPKALSF